MNNTNAADPVRIEPLRAPPGRFVVSITGQRAPLDPESTERVDRAWDALRRSNPKYHDGQLLRVVGADADDGAVTCEIDAYRNFAVQPAVDTGTRLLGVNGVVTATGEGERRVVLLGHRAPQTRDYPALWECAPAGGVDPVTGAPSFDHAALLQSLVREADEELASSIDFTQGRAVALCWDDTPPSVDVVVAVSIDGPPPPVAPSDGSWEYTALRWVALDDIDGADGPGGIRLAPPAEAILRFIRDRHPRD